MAVFAEASDLAHPKGRAFAMGGDDLHAALGQPLGDRLTLTLNGEGAKVLLVPGRLFTLAI
jgi:hypothetical protein